MLIGFAIENWACFRDRQEFSMETAGRVEEEFAFDTGVTRYPRLNRVATIYGPNGSGKSRFVDALVFMRGFVIGSARDTQAGDLIEIKPFCFDTRSLEKPTSFEISFIQDKVLYEYGFIANTERIWEEWLFVRFPGGRLRRWFERKLVPESGKYKWAFSSSLPGPHMIWRETTRPNALFVSTAVQLNSDSLNPIIEWFQNLTVVGSEGISPRRTSYNLSEKSDNRARVINFLQQADIQVSDIRIREEELSFRRSPLYKKNIPSPPDLPPRIRKIVTAEFGLPIKGSDTLAYLELDEQSDGTQRMYSLALPWLDFIDQDRVIVIDELDRNLHPHLVKFLIEFINRPRETRAQLVATMHDAIPLQERDVLDRNQVWFTDKDSDQAASLVPLSDYRPRKRESLLRGYLGGRYGAIPNVADPRLN